MRTVQKKITIKTATMTSKMIEAIEIPTMLIILVYPTTQMVAARPGTRFVEFTAFSTRSKETAFAQKYLKNVTDEISARKVY